MSPTLIRLKELLTGRLLPLNGFILRMRHLKLLTSMFCMVTVGVLPWNGFGIALPSVTIVMQPLFLRLQYRQFLSILRRFQR